MLRVPARSTIRSWRFYSIDGSRQGSATNARLIVGARLESRRRVGRYAATGYLVNTRSAYRYTDATHLHSPVPSERYPPHVHLYTVQYVRRAGPGVLESCVFVYFNSYTFDVSSVVSALCSLAHHEAAWLGRLGGAGAERPTGNLLLLNILTS